MSFYYVFSSNFLQAETPTSQVEGLKKQLQQPKFVSGQCAAVSQIDTITGAWSQLASILSALHSSTCSHTGKIICSTVNAEALNNYILLTI